MKKLALTGALALLCIGCVIAAGCTSAPAATDDPITGVWFSNYTDGYGTHAKAMLLIDGDGTATSYAVYDDGAVRKGAMTWNRTDDGIYAILYSNGEERTYTMNAAKDTMDSPKGAVIEKIAGIAGTAAKMLGPWCNEKTGTVTTFIADGTGTICKYPDLIGTFTWTTGDDGTFRVHYLTGGFAGRDAVWTYDETTDTLSGDDGLFSVVRPTKSADGITIMS